MLLIDFVNWAKRTIGSDPSYWDLPSISPHWQNRGFRDWVVLIELLREAWQAVGVTHPSGQPG